MHRFVLSITALVALVTTTFAQITLGHFDDFQDGTLMGWGGGDTMQNIATGGPLGAGDRFLQITSNGGIGAGGKLGTFNGLQWAGNYNTAGVTVVSGWFRNLGATEIHLRLVIHDFGDFPTRWTSTVAQGLAPGGGWLHLSFSLDEADLTRVLGTATYAETMASVDRIMVRHQSGPPSDQAQSIIATLGMDMMLATEESSTQIVLPTSYSVVEGVEPIHNLQALLFSDDVRLEVRANSANVSTTRIEYTTTAPQMNVDRLSFMLECHTQDPTRQRAIDLWNYTSGAWEQVSLTTGTTSDSTVTVNINADPDRFIHPTTREMRARTRLSSPFITRTFQRVIDQYDRAVWELEG